MLLFSAFLGILELSFSPFHYVTRIAEEKNIAKIQHTCDNDSAVKNAEHAPFTQQQMLDPEADIILAIHHQAKQLLGFHLTKMMTRSLKI